MTITIETSRTMETCLATVPQSHSNARAHFRIDVRSFENRARFPASIRSARFSFSLSGSFFSPPFRPFFFFFFFLLSFFVIAAPALLSPVADYTPLNNLKIYSVLFGAFCVLCKFGQFMPSWMFNLFFQFLGVFLPSFQIKLG